jgi:hypothetical protein
MLLDAGGGDYLSSTLMSSTQIILLFSEMLKSSKIISSKSKNIIVKEKSEYFRNIPFVEIN